jgi:mono/diheme cytochrome c family protein
VSLSADTGQRNFTLGQDKDLYDVRLRATGSDRNGLPSTSSPAKSLRPRLTHVVYTRDARGEAVIFVDGKQAASKTVDGNLDNWDGGYRLALANEITGDRPWLGEFHLVAIYSRALSGKEVQQNYAAGASAGAASQADLIAADRGRAFETQIAPLFAKHCLECHDTALKKGGLDLSRREAALAGGESGPVIVPGKAAESALWELVSSGEMPRSRSPLEAEQLAALRKWIEDGAVWPIDVIDPANYRHTGSAGHVWVQRLTVPEYIETVRSALGVDIATEARELLPPDLRADGFSNTAYNLGVDLKHVEAYNRLAEIIVSRLDVPAFARRFSETRKFDDDKMREFVAALGKRLLRGPLNENEINLYRGIASTVSSAGGDYDDAVRFIIEAMLQSPRFVYRIEEQRGDGGPRHADPYELASRMSYILWGAPPDEDLFGAAERGELADRVQVEQQVARMLQDPRAIDRSLQFVSEWLNLGRLANLRPDSERFPNWNAQLAADMREETLAYFREVVWTQNRPLTDLLNAQVTFATPRLAEHYGLAPAGEGLSRYDLSQVPRRGGLLTQGSVLTIGGDEASMVTRGLFVLHELLRGTINAPPPCVNTTPPPTKAGLTQRGIAEARIADEKCGVCHGRFEPLAFGLEKFDGVGAFHERDRHGNPLRDDGEVLFPGEARPVKYASSRELMDLLAGSPRVRHSLTWKVAQFAIGRPLGAADAATLATIDKAAQEGGGTYAALIRAIVLSDLVLLRGSEKDK